MKKVIALSAFLVMGALGMACGDAATNNSNTKSNATNTTTTNTSTNGSTTTNTTNTVTISSAWRMRGYWTEAASEARWRVIGVGRL